MGGQNGDTVDAGGSDGGIWVPEPARDAGEHLDEVRGEGVSVGLRENRQEVYALFPHRRLVRGVGAVDAREEHREGAGFQGPSDGLQLGGSIGVGVPVRELGEACEHPVLEVLRRRGRGGQRHCVCFCVLNWSGFSRVGRSCRRCLRRYSRSSFGGLRAEQSGGLSLWI